MDLYPHNQKAYEALERMLAEHGRACVVHPTGTGKTMIGVKHAEEHPEERILWLSPSDYILAEQQDNLGGAFPANIEPMTYSMLWADVRAGRPVREGYGCIVLDEFHRCGAEKWSQGVGELLVANPGCEIIGLSATPVRFSDEGRNMADELFDGHVASEMTLPQAWILGILPKPVYITSIYSAPDELEHMRVRIEQVKDAGEKSTLRKRYNKLRRRLMDAGGIPGIFAKHLKKPDARLIVFCPGSEALRDLYDQRFEWFQGVNRDVHAYRVFQKNPYGSVEMRGFKADDSKALKVLYCIDQLNEGVHVKGVDGIVMARPTGSPIIFHQQLGRALDAGAAKRGERPLVFDFCNNLGSLGEYMGSISKAYEDVIGEGLEPVYGPDDFEIFDEVRDFRELTEMIDKALEPWSIDECLDYLEATR